MSEIKTVDFRGHEFQVRKGSTHPEYSFFTFTGEEKDFREKYWDIKPGDVVVDAGASYGAYTLAALAAGAAHVIAFEPEPTVNPDLIANIDLNGWGVRCNVFPVGLWSQETTIEMQSYAPHWPAQTITAPFRMSTLDRVIEKWGGIGFPQLDWIKIDIEGAELEALKGAVGTIRNFRPRLVVEVHTFLDVDLLPRIVEFFKKEIGRYEFEVVDRKPCEMLIARPG